VWFDSSLVSTVSARPSDRSAGNPDPHATVRAELVHATPDERGDLADQLKTADEDGNEATHLITDTIEHLIGPPFDGDNIHRLALSPGRRHDAMGEAGKLGTASIRHQ